MTAQACFFTPAVWVDARMPWLATRACTRDQGMNKRPGHARTGLCVGMWACVCESLRLCDLRVWPRNMAMHLTRVGARLALGPPGPELKSPRMVWPNLAAVWHGAWQALRLVPTNCPTELLCCAHLPSGYSCVPWMLWFSWCFLGRCGCAA